MFHSYQLEKKTKTKKGVFTVPKVTSTYFNSASTYLYILENIIRVN